MAFKLVYHSQQDPQWKNDTLGFGGKGDTIGYVGYALTSVAMLLSGHGFEETPKSLNQKMKNRQGFVNAGIRWSVVSQVHPDVKLKANINCESGDAPLGQIDAALAAGQPVIVRVDASPNPGLQWHYVMLYARKGDDYLMLDPWPYKPGTDKEDFLMKRYSQGRSLRRAIQQVLIYEAANASGPVEGPTDTDLPTPADGVYARVMEEVTSGLNIRSSTNTSSMANIIAVVTAGTRLLLLREQDKDKIGQTGQWVRVREPGGREGFAAAWYLEKVGGTSPAPAPEPFPPREEETPSPAPEPAPSPEQQPAPAEKKRLTVIVSEAVGTSGLRLRKTPSKGGALIMVVRAGAELVVMEDPKKAKTKLGKANKWLSVREAGGKRGYVGAEYVRLP
jgi:hypothetical protein